MAWKYSPQGPRGAAGAGGWRALLPAPLAIDRSERLRVVLGVFVGLSFAAWVSASGWRGGPWPWLMAPLGASAVLVFALPTSPLAQPWPVLVGNTVSAAVGVAVVQGLPWPTALAAPLAAALAVAAMLATRSLHPPGGAVALLAVVSAADPRFVLAPVMSNTVLLLVAGVTYNRLSGRAYPHVQRPVEAVDEARPVVLPARFSDSDLQAVLAQRNQLVDLPTDELRELLEAAELRAHRRRLQQLRCADIMSPGPVTARPAETAAQALQRMHERQVKALPVLDAADRLVGIVTREDCLQAGAGTAAPGLPGAPAPAAEPATRVRDIMSRRVRVASSGLSLADLVPEFAAGGHHHLPVLDSQQRLVGMVTQTDVVAALLREEDGSPVARRGPAA